MFFVSLLLNQIVSWMRAQPGTSSLRTLVYMDEIAGYFPPVANPPSKQPFLTLLKQGRAFGVGMLLATQNPVDLDYKGLSNAGTWLLGRLQTERDKARVLDGLEGVASGSLERAEADRILSALGKRQFLLHDVHNSAPIVFQSRWALSFLRGPLTRDQIRALMGNYSSRSTAAPRAAVRPSASAAASASTTKPPVVPPSIPQYVVPRSNAGRYIPMALGVARIAFSDTKLKIAVTRVVAYAAPISDSAVPVDWAESTKLDVAVNDLRPVSNVESIEFAPLPAAAAQPRNYAGWSKDFGRFVAQTERLQVFRHPTLKSVSQAGESERDFRIRLQLEARAARDQAVDDVRRKYASKQATLTERLRRAEAAVGREQEQASQQRTQTAVSFGATVLGALFGRKAISTGTLGRATTAARGVSRSMKEAADVKRATETVEAIQAQLRGLEQQIESDVAESATGFDINAPLEAVAVAPKRGQIEVKFVALGWVPEA
jgi:hypothetical protein